MVTGKAHARLRLVIVDGEAVSRGYKSGRKSERDTPDAASSASTRSAGILPKRRHFWTAWYRTPSFSAMDLSPPPPTIALSTASMPSTLQPPVAERQQLPVAIFFNSMQPMVASDEKEREAFKLALNARVAKEHPEVRGRPRWLHGQLVRHAKAKRLKGKVVSVATCAYWLAGKKIAALGNDTLLCDVLGMTRGELFGESSDPRLQAIVERWQTLPEHLKNGIHGLVSPEEQPTLYRKAI